MRHFTAEENKMEDSKAIIETKNSGRFLDQYIEEKNPDNRLKMAEEFLLDGAQDRWLYVYGLVSKQIESAANHSSTSAKKTQKVVEVERSEGVRNILIDWLVEYSTNNHSRRLFLKAYYLNIVSN